MATKKQAKPKKTYTIVVFSDGETWEVLGPGMQVHEIDERAFRQLERGEYPKSLKKTVYTASLQDIVNDSLDNRDE